MSNIPDLSLIETTQSPGIESKSKRNSGLFSFFKWFKSSTSRESLNSSSVNSSSESLTSLHSTGTVASFSYIDPNAYPINVTEKLVQQRPETDTYKNRLLQRDKRRENDKNLTLRKKYNLFFNKTTLLKITNKNTLEESTKSLPLMTRANNKIEETDERLHRRTNSESSKIKKAGAYLHVKGKRKAPQPPKKLNNETSTLSLRRKNKRFAPPPPEKIQNIEIIQNDTLKLDHGILKSAKQDEVALPQQEIQENIYATCSPLLNKTNDDNVSPKPWYKRNSKENTIQAKKDFFQLKNEHKYEKIERLPEVSFNRNSIIELEEEKRKENKKEDKRKSAVTQLPNISELDREAAEILQKEKEKNDIYEIPEFMKPKEVKINANDSLAPKKRSAKDLIAKFNAITSVTRVTVFGPSKESKKDYFGKTERKHQEALLESHKKRIEMIDKKLNPEKKITQPAPLMKSESVSVVKKPETPKADRKSWSCPKCSVNNEYWRIICHVCSTIKPYFDDWTSSPSPRRAFFHEHNAQKQGILERSKTQIGFSVISNSNINKNNKLNTSQSVEDKHEKIYNREEKEKLKKMLIDMKNSLPKRKHNLKQNPNRTSIIDEKLEDNDKLKENKPDLELLNPEKKFKRNNNELKSEIEHNHQIENIFKESTKTNVLESQEEKNTQKNNSEIEPVTDNKLVSDEIKIKENVVEDKIIEILLGKQTTIYENIKVKKETPKPAKISSAAQTSVSLHDTKEKEVNVTGMVKKKNSFKLMKEKDFENIYEEGNVKNSPRNIYANLSRNYDLSLFFNMPTNLTELKNTLGKMKLQKNTNTIEINRLLRKLEMAIASGKPMEAANFAKELAQLKVNCSVVRQKSEESSGDEKEHKLVVNMYVEDKVSHRGPFALNVKQNQTVGELKLQVEKEFEIPVNVQRWILGKDLALDDKKTLEEFKLTSECAIFLYLVAPDNNKLKGETSHEFSKAQTLKIEEAGSVTPVKEENKTNKQTLPTTKANDEPTTSYNIEEHKKPTPKIIDVVPKNQNDALNTTETAAPNLTPKIESKKDSDGSKHNFNEVVTQTVTTVLFAPKEDAVYHQIEDNDEDFEVKTLKPSKEWECHLCTLLNPISTRVCQVCATVRLQAPEKIPRKNKAAEKTQPSVPSLTITTDQTYLQLVHLDNTDLVNNVEPFECLICFTEVPPMKGVTLRECLHQFCKECLQNTIEFNEEIQVKCPYRDEQYSCNLPLQDREIKNLVSKEKYDQYLAKSIIQAENKIDKSFHCKTPDCKGWCIFEDNVNEFRCPVCRRVNCLTCQAIHMGINCKQYQERMNEEAETDENAKRTKEMLQEMVNKGEALNCPTCQVVMMKKWGCDWLRCSMCKTEICWVTKGPRWGPAGKGDISGGCQCGVNGVKCHPKCNYCH